MSETRPLRAVTGSRVMTGRGSVLGGDTWRRLRWYVLTLECGHQVERNVRYTPAPHRVTQRQMTDALPAPARARCDACGRS